MASRNDSVSDQRNDVIDITKYGEKQSRDTEYQKSDRSRKHKNQTDEPGRWYGRDIENESLNHSNTSRSSDHENGIEDTVDEKEGASSLDDSFAKQLHPKKPTYEEDHKNGNETSSSLSDSEDLSDDIENDKEELTDRKSVSNDAKQMHPTKKISNKERSSDVLKGDETSNSLSGSEDPGEDIDNEKEEISDRKSVENDAKQMLSKKEISAKERSRHVLNDKETLSSLFDNEEYNENNARDEGEPINEEKQVYSKRPAQEEGHDSEAVSGKETSSSLFDHEEKNGGHPNLEYSEKESGRKSEGENSAKQLHSEKRILEEDTDLEDLNGNETTTNMFHNEEQSEDITGDRGGPSERKSQDDSYTNQGHFNETFLEEDRGTEALNGNETSSNLFDNEEQSGDKEDNRNELSERKRKDDNDLKQGHSNETVFEEDRGTEALNANETSSNLFDNEQQTGDNVEGKQDKSEKKFKDENRAKQFSQSKKPINEEDRGNEALHGNETSGSSIDSEKRNGDIADDREGQSDRKFDDDDDAKQGHLKKLVYEEGRSNQSLNGNETLSSLFDNEEHKEYSGDDRNTRDELSDRKDKDDDDSKRVLSDKTVREKSSQKDHSNGAVRGNETSSSALRDEEQSGDIVGDRDEQSERQFDADNDEKYVYSQKPNHQEDRGIEALNSNETAGSLFDNEQHENYSGNNGNDKVELTNRKPEDDNGVKHLQSNKSIHEENHGSEEIKGNEMSSNFFGNEEQSGDSKDNRKKLSKRKFKDDKDMKKEHFNETFFEEDRSTEALKGNETSSNLFDKEGQSVESKNSRKELSKRKFKNARQEHSEETFFEEDRSTEALNNNETSSNLFDNEGYIAEQRREAPEAKPKNDEGAKQVHSKKAFHEKDHAGKVLNGNEKLFDNEEQEHEVDNGEELSERKFKDKDKKQGHPKQPVDRETEFWGNETLNNNETSSNFFDNEEQNEDNEDNREENSESLFQDEANAKHFKRANHGNENVNKDLNGIETLIDNEEQNADNVDGKEKHSETWFEDENDAIQGDSKKEIHETIHVNEGNETSSNLSDSEDQSGDIEDDKKGKSEENSVDKDGVKQAHSKEAINEEDDSHASRKKIGKQRKGNAKKDDEIEETHDQREGKEYRGDYQKERFFYDDDDDKEEKYDDEEPVKRQNLGMNVPLST